MRNIAFLQNLDAATRLPDGSIGDLMKRLAKVEKGMSDVDKAKIDAAIADAFMSVSALLDNFEKVDPEHRTNASASRPRYGSQAWANNAQKSGFSLPKASD